MMGQFFWGGGGMECTEGGTVGHQNGTFTFFDTFVMD